MGTPTTNGKRSRESSVMHDDPRWRPGTLEQASPIDVWRLTRRFLIAVAVASAVFALVLWGPWY